MTSWSPRMPDVPLLGLGVGLDLPHGARAGFRQTSTGPVVEDRVVSFLRRHATDFHSLFVSWQPSDRGALCAERAAAPFLNLFARAPAYHAYGLHHTALNTGAPESGAPDDVLAFTVELVERCGFSWVNEDLGIWSLQGMPLPYPLPPIFTTAGLRACIKNVDKVQRALPVPFVVEFPGVTDGATVVFGKLEAYDYFRRVVHETGSPCTLDTGHLLGWRFLQGFRGAALFDDLDRLPLASCFEIHLSGCSIASGQFLDTHNGVLLQEQLLLLERLVPLCPNLRVVTYEDPRFLDDGTLIEKARPGFDALRRLAERLFPGRPAHSGGATGAVGAPT